MERQLKQSYGVKRFSCFVCDYCCVCMFKLKVHCTKSMLHINKNHIREVKIWGTWVAQ